MDLTDLDYLGRQRVVRVYSSAFVWDVRMQTNTFQFCLVVCNFDSFNYYIDQPVQGDRISYKQEVRSLPSKKVSILPVAKCNRPWFPYSEKGRLSHRQLKSDP